MLFDYTATELDLLEYKLAAIESAYCDNSHYSTHICMQAKYTHVTVNMPYTNIPLQYILIEHSDKWVQDKTVHCDCCTVNNIIAISSQLYKLRNF